jgi:hypothetical protein
MNMNQIGMLLELLGFLLVTVFAAILLERGALGILRGKGEVLFALLASTINKLSFSWGREVGTIVLLKFPGQMRLSTLGVGRFGSMLLLTIGSAIPLGAFVCIIIGWLQTRWWMVGLGAFLFCMAVVYNFYEMLPELEDTANNYIRETGRPRSAAQGMLIALFVFTLFSSIFSVLIIPVCLFLGIVRIFQIIVSLLSSKDSIKKASILLGALLVLVGLILQFISTL